MHSFNVYEDAARARSYAALKGFPGTYHLAYRDLPGILARHVRGTRALDFGCGAGRSTRFLRQQGFEVVGVDRSPQMLDEARSLDPGGDYRLSGTTLACLGDWRADLVLSVFTFDNVPNVGKPPLTREHVRVLAPGGRIVHVVSSPEIYVNEWASFSTRQFPANRTAQAGGVVRTIITDTDDPRPVDDILCPDDVYERIFRDAGLAVDARYRPLATGREGIRWKAETRVPPWAIYVCSVAAVPPA